MMIRILSFLAICLGFGLTLIIPITRAEAEWATFVQNDSRLCARVTEDLDPCGQLCTEGPNWTRMACPENFTMVDASPPVVVCETVNCGPPYRDNTEKTWTETIKYRMLDILVYLIDQADLALSRLGLE